LKQAVNLSDYFENSLNIIQNRIFEIAVDLSYTFFVDDKKINLFFGNKVLYSKLAIAFNHLKESRQVNRQLDVFIVDEDCFPMSLLSPPWIEEGVSYKNDIWISDEADLKIQHHPFKGTLMMLDLLNDKAIYWVKSGSKIPYYESSSPLRSILHVWMSSYGSQLLHAAAVGIKNKGILLVGKGGSGKSNTAVSCLNSELYYLADDYCLLSFKPDPTVFSLFATAKLLFEDVARYPFLDEVQLKANELDMRKDKALFFLHPIFENRMIGDLPIKAIFIPKVANILLPKITPISSSKAYLALAPSTIFQMHGSKDRTHENIVRLLKEVPSFLFELSSETSLNSKAIQNFLHKL
jgi:hypothetical protein